MGSRFRILVLSFLNPLLRAAAGARSSPAVSVRIVGAACGFVFLLAGLGKLPEKVHFIDQVAAYHVLPYPLAYILGTILPWLELVLGLLLILGLFPRLVAGLALPLIVSFMVANGLSLYRGEIVCHSCFGEIVIAIPTPLALVVDGGLLLSMIILMHGRRKHSGILQSGESR